MASEVADGVGCPEFDGDGASSSVDADRRAEEAGDMTLSAEELEEELVLLENELIEMEQEVALITEDDDDEETEEQDDSVSSSVENRNGATRSTKTSRVLSEVRCTVCGEPFETMTEYLQHRTAEHPDALRKTTDTLYLCPLCPDKMLSKTALKNHLKDKHPGRKDIFKCETCERFFKSREHLVRHERIHTDIRPYKCDTCSKSFPWPEHLKAHTKIHFPVRGYECKHCSQKFTSNSALNKHERMHAGTNRYVCEICGEGFHVSEPYKIHLRKHAGVRPFECGQCGKQYYSRAACRRHTMTHVNHRPYQCLDCNKSFRDRQSLERHGLVHSGVKPFQCAHCGLGLATKHNLAMHMKKIHPEKEGKNVEKSSQSDLSAATKPQSLTGSAFNSTAPLPLLDILDVGAEVLL